MNLVDFDTRRPSRAIKERCCELALPIFAHFFSVSPFGAIDASAQTEQIDRGARVPISISNPAPKDAVRGGVLFEAIKKVKNSAELSSILSGGAVVFISGKNYKIETSVGIVEFYTAIIENCRGPFSIDEGRWPAGDRAKWVQTSWVCRINANSPLNKYFAFKFSPEIDLEFEFSDDKIKLIFATEITPAPGRKILEMNAADTMEMTSPN